MASHTLCGSIVFVGVLFLSLRTFAAEEVRDNTCFQVAAPYSAELDVGSDVAIVYGVNGSFAERVANWRLHGYTASMMTGIAWGGYDAYYRVGDSFKKEEVQTAKSGRLFMHGQSKTVGYNVPTPAYVEFIKQYVEPAVEAGVRAVYMEEPEYWAETGWSEAFKRAWQDFYGEPWMPPDSSVDAQYRASRLKYELYFNALREVFRHVKTLAAEKRFEIECHVPTHSLINYAHWRIVSPESHLVDIPELDGYIAQVWTGTARTPNVYAGVSKSRTFETAFFEYGQMLAMVRPTGRKVWFLADPIEDNPNRSWDDYKRNYECTIVASLVWPGVHRFEVMPWPNRIFRGKYPKVDLEIKSGERQGIAADYATQILIVINALNEMNQSKISYDTGTRGIGIVVSDTMMFQRAAPSPSCPDLGSFYGLALPLLKAGVPLEVVQLENAVHADCLEPYDVLLLTYEGQKPLRPEYHEAIAQWVRDGGGLIYFGKGTDPYHHVREWWNEQGRTDARAQDDLFDRLGVLGEARVRPQRVGKGCVRVVLENPSEIQQTSEGADSVRRHVAEMLGQSGRSLETQNYLCVRRGPFVVVSVLDESVLDEPFRIEGSFVDLFDPALPVVSTRVLHAEERALLYDLEWAKAHGVKAKVVGAGARIRNDRFTKGVFSFTARGPAGTTANARVLLPGAPLRIVTKPELDLVREWDEPSGTLWLTFQNRGEDAVIEIELGKSST